MYRPYPTSKITIANSQYFLLLGFNNSHLHSSVRIVFQRQQALHIIIHQGNIQLIIKVIIKESQPKHIKDTVSKAQLIPYVAYQSWELASDEHYLFLHEVYHHPHQSHLRYQQSSHVSCNHLQASQLLPYKVGKCRLS